MFTLFGTVVKKRFGSCTQSIRFWINPSPLISTACMAHDCLDGSSFPGRPRHHHHNHHYHHHHLLVVVVVVIIIIIMIIVTMNINIQGCVSLLKSKNGSRIQLIHNGSGFFGSYTNNRIESKTMTA